MLVFPIETFLDNSKCHDYLKSALHPKGFSCRCGHELPKGQKPHKYSSRKTPYYRCVKCHSVFNIFTDTIFEGIVYGCTTIFLMLRGFLKGETTSHMSKELGVNYKNLLDWRHILQEFCFENRDLSVFKDTVIESDEVFINAGQKGEEHPFVEDPPRVRANKKKA
jgi:transposase-like protein